MFNNHLKFTCSKWNIFLCPNFLFLLFGQWQQQPSIVFGWKSWRCHWSLSLTLQCQSTNKSCPQADHVSLLPTVSQTEMASHSFPSCLLLTQGLKYSLSKMISQIILFLYSKECSRIIFSLLWAQHYLDEIIWSLKLEKMIVLFVKQSAQLIYLRFFQTLNYFILSFDFF